MLAALTLPVLLLALHPAAPCEGLDLVGTLGDLRSSTALEVERQGTELVLSEVGSGAPILVASCDGLLLQGPERFEPPPPDQRAITHQVRDADGELLYTHAITSRGARITVLPAGGAAPDGLHVIAFDNDDVHVSDSKGRLMYSRTTTGVGALIEREGQDYGCGCERRTEPDGRVEVRPL